MIESPPGDREQQQLASPEARQQEKSPGKTEVEMKKDKKKKKKALTDFLSKPDSDVIDLPRRNEEEPVAEYSESAQCKICGDLSQKRKPCQFCRETVCSEHFRKKRKFKGSGKFARICDDCEDKYIYDKYMKLEGKAEEAILMQQMIIQGKHEELNELVESKQITVEVLKGKRRELQEQKKGQDHRIKIQNNDINLKDKRLGVKLAEQAALNEQVLIMQESFPPPLDNDYNCLVDQNNKINKELVKYQKKCSEGLKAKSTREKDLYEAYYKWEKKETVKKETNKKKDDCLVY